MGQGEGAPAARRWGGVGAAPWPPSAGGGPDRVGRRELVRAAGVGAAGLAAAVLPLASAAAAGGRPRAAADGQRAAPRAAAVAPVWLYMSILTGRMVGRKDWPEFVPADTVVPAHTVVQVQIRCFDDGTAEVPPGYEFVRGTLSGDMVVIKAVNGPVEALPGVTVKALPSTGVSHTWTFADFNLNVPIPPLSTVRFAFRTPAAGRYGWQCMAACSVGRGGWGGAMETAGWMLGTMTVV